MTPELALGMGIPAIGVIVWLVRLEGRVNGHDLLLKDIREDLAYIRARLDALVNHR
jgi:hypothetical protein